MGYFLLILIFLFLVWPLLRRPLSQWFSRFMARRAEDMMRRMAGMPPRNGKSTRKRKNEESRNRARQSKPPKPHPAAMMKSVAEDAVYTEIREFESTTIVENTDEQTRTVIEEQVTDVEYTEIKTK